MGLGEKRMTKIEVEIARLDINGRMKWIGRDVGETPIDHLVGQHVLFADCAFECH